MIIDQWSGSMPEISTAGHISGTGVTDIIGELEKLKVRALIIKGCPVNRRILTRMEVYMFESMCMKFQKRAGLLNTTKVNGSSSTVGGWVTNNVTICTDCEIGAALREGKQYTPPYNLIFETRENLHGYKSN